MVNTWSYIISGSGDHQYGTCHFASFIKCKSKWHTSVEGCLHVTQVISLKYEACFEMNGVELLYTFTYTHINYPLSPMPHRFPCSLGDVGPIVGPMAPITSSLSLPNYIFTNLTPISVIQTHCPMNFQLLDTIKLHFFLA